MKKKAFRCRNIYTSLTPQLIDGYVICDRENISFVGSCEDAEQYIDLSLIHISEPTRH